MKKIVAFMCVVIMTICMSVTVLAQPSVQVTGVVTSISEAKDAKGIALRMGIRSVADEYQTAVSDIKANGRIREFLGDDYVEGMQVIDVKSVSVPEGTEFPVTVTFDVTGVTANSKIAILCYNPETNTWEKVEAVVSADGKITVVFTSAAQLEVVAFVVDKETADAVPASSAGSSSVTGASASGSASAISPKTGETNVMMWTVLIAAAAFTGMIFTYGRKERV